MLAHPDDDRSAPHALQAARPAPAGAPSGDARLRVYAHDLADFDGIGLIAALRDGDGRAEFRTLDDLAAPSPDDLRAPALILFPDPIRRLAQAVAGDAPLADALTEIRRQAEGVLSALRIRAAGKTLFIDDALFSDPGAVAAAIGGAGVAYSPEPDVVDRAIDPVARVIALESLRRDPATLVLCEELEARAQPWRSARAAQGLRASAGDVALAAQAWRALRANPPRAVAESDFLREITSLQERCAALLLERDALAATLGDRSAALEALTLQHRHATEREAIALRKIESLNETISEKNQKLHAMSQKKKAVTGERDALQAELSAIAAKAEARSALNFWRKR